MNVRCKYKATLVFTVLQFLVLGGIVSGWGPISYVLKNENIFSSGCPKYYNLSENRNFAIGNLFNTTNTSRIDLTLWEFHSKYVTEYCVSLNSYISIRAYLEDTYNISRLNVLNLLNSETYNLSYCTKNTESDHMCPSQNKNINLVFTIMIICRLLSGVIWGFAYDYFGVWVCEGIGTMLIFIGCLSTSFVKPDISFVLFISISMIEVGSRFIVETNFPVANLFRKNRTFVLIVLTTAVGTSPWLGVTIKLLFDDGYGIKYSFAAFSIISILFIPKILCLSPRKHIPYVVPENFDYGACISHHATSSSISHDATVNLVVDEHKEKIDEENGEKSIKQCLLSLPFISYMLCKPFFVLRHTFALGTQYPWLMSLVNDERAVSYYLNIFGFLPLLNIIISPMVAMAVERFLRYLRDKQLPDVQVFRYSAIIMFTLVSLVYSLASALILIPYVPIQGLSFVLLDLAKILNMASVPNFLMAYFPRKHFGKLTGILCLPTALILTLQYFMYVAVVDLFHNFVFINAIFLILSFCSFACPVVLYLK